MFFFSLSFLFSAAINHILFNNTIVNKQKSVAGEFIFQIGLFGFAGGITNWLAVKMLFDRIPFLYGSGVIPARFKEIRETVKNTIMKTFFDEVYLERYIREKADKLKGNIDITAKLTEVLNSPKVDKVMDEKLTELGTRPEGMMFAMMGIQPIQLKPVIKPFITGMAEGMAVSDTKLLTRSNERLTGPWEDPRRRERVVRNELSFGV